MTEVVGARETGAHLGLLGDLPRERTERLEGTDEDVLVALDPLEAPAREHERLAAHDRAMLVVDRGWNDEVDRSELVLDQHEDDAVRCRRTLPGDRHAGDRNLCAVRSRLELTRREDAAWKMGAQQLQRMD